MAKWKRVPGWPNYEVSDDGQVRSFARGKLRIMRLYREGSGYVRVGMSRGSTKSKRKVAVHRMVLLAFVGEPAKGQEVRHLDGVRHNNKLSNLCWGNKKENMSDQIRHGTRRAGERQHTAKLTKGDVVEIRRAYATGGTSYPILGRKYGVSFSTIGRIVKREIWGHVCGHQADSGAECTRCDDERNASRPPATECKRGHAFTDENTIVQKNGGRRCRECQRAVDRNRDRSDYMREWRAARRKRTA